MTTTRARLRDTTALLSPALLLMPMLNYDVYDYAWRADSDGRAYVRTRRGYRFGDMIPLPVLKDWRTTDRIAISRAYLGRDPHVLRFPDTGAAFWVEAEPDDWADFLEYADRRDGVEAEAKRIKREGMH